jgi:exoribonuclease-2
MRARGFDPEFPRAVLEEARQLTAPPAPPDRRDLRDLPWTSIDNDDSRDLDQLTVAEPMSPGHTRIRVAIADVDVLVHRGSAIDQRAALHTTSVYTAAAVFPMLPERLSTDLTSLDPGQDRAALVVEFTVRDDGAVTAAAIVQALVRNHAQLAYNSVGEWFDGHAQAPPRVLATRGLANNLRLQESASQALRRRRHERGALTLQTRESRAVFQGDALQAVTEDHPNRAKELIEEFMIAANAATAATFVERRVPSLRRAVRVPKRWDRIVALAAGTGTHLPATPDSESLSAWLRVRQAADPEGFADLSLSVIKLIGRGEYVVQDPDAPAVGHFGLALQEYTHATAPNRRFADLVTQRLLKSSLQKHPAPYARAELEAIAARCNDRATAAEKVERQVQKSAAALLLAERVGERFEALITGVNKSGTWVRLKQPAVEGRLEAGFENLDVGDRVRVRLLRTDVRRGFLDFARA